MPTLVTSIAFVRLPPISIRSRVVTIRLLATRSIRRLLLTAGASRLELRPPPLQRGLETVRLHPAAEFAPHLGLRGIERHERIDPGLYRGAKARDLRAAVDHAFTPPQRLGS